MSKKETTIRIQPEELGDGKLPYPFFIKEGGFVGRQDFWNGHPYKLVGFEKQIGKFNITLSVEEFLQSPVLAVGLYPVFEKSDGEWYSLSQVIDKVDVL